MKLNEVDRTLNEGALDSLWASTKAMGLSAVGDKDAAQQVLAKNKFADTFVKKMSTLLATQWPAIEKVQQEKLADQQRAQAAQQQKDQAMATKAAPQAAQPSTIIDPNTGKPYAQQSTSESYNLFRRKFDKVLKEASAQETTPGYGMGDYIMRTLSTYMNPIDITPYNSQLADFAKNIAATYQSNHGIPAMKKLGRFLYDITKSYQETQGMAPPKEEKPDERVQSVLNTIKNLTDEEKQKLMASLQPQAK